MTITPEQMHELVREFTETQEAFRKTRDWRCPKTEREAVQVAYQEQLRIFTDMVNDTLKVEDNT